MSKKNEEKNHPETSAEKQEASLEPEASREPEKAQETETAPEPEKSEAELLGEKLQEANDKYLRMLAEYDNYRRRSQKERESIYADVRADTVKKLLPVYDNLLRAVAQEPNEDLRKGMEAILTQFTAILTALGVTEIEAVGKKFDPTLHEALLHIEDEKYGEGEIVMELERGFKLGDKVIRFSKVQVAN
jgi:molecular chaperone GrpE